MSSFNCKFKVGFWSLLVVIILAAQGVLATGGDIYEDLDDPYWPDYECTSKVHCQ